MSEHRRRSTSSRREGGRRDGNRRAPRRPTLAGLRFTVEVGPVAHGGHCVARLPAGSLAATGEDLGGTVVFVRHTLPGERVVVVLTDGRPGDRFVRGDAVEVLVAVPERVPAPCPVSGPGGCGGCDFQHVEPAHQRRLKAQVVAEQLQRLAGVTWDGEVEPVPGDADGLRWRTRMRYHPVPGGGRGLRAHRSERVVPVEDCLLEAPGAHVVIEGEPDTESLVEDVRGRRFEVAGDGFWQVHRGAPETLVAAVLDAAQVGPGDRVLDLYAGVGLFTAFLAEISGPTGRVLAVEGDRRAAAYARENLADLPWVEVRDGSVEDVVAGLPAPYDVVVLDPPRVGARRVVVEQVAALAPRRVVYVACDPAAFARDVAIFAEQGYRLGGLRAFDLFPMTHHVECVATLVSSGADG